MKNILIVFPVLLFLACTRIQTINLKPHKYSERPSNIIWIQLAGFTEQHLPLLKFNVPDSKESTQFESADCIGKMWSYNLYDLRPSASMSFLSQLTGSKNITGTCEDLSKKPIWSYLEEQGYKTVILESGATNNESVEKFYLCGDEQKNFMKNVRLMRMGPEKNNFVGSFHYQDTASMNADTAGIFYDKSCQKGECYTTIFNNAQKILQGPTSSGSSHLYIVRDFSYLNALVKKDIHKAREILFDLERIQSWIMAQNRNDTLVIISGAAGLEINFPKDGKDWEEFEKTGKNINFGNSTLLSSVFARGPMSENMCGLFEESELLKRLLHHPEGKVFSWDAINPISR